MLVPCIIVYKDTGEYLKTELDMVEIFGKEIDLGYRLYKKIDFDANTEIIIFKDEYYRDEYYRVVDISGDV
jgi:hypothetical protein